MYKTWQSMRPMAVLVVAAAGAGGCAQNTAFLDSVKPVERVQGRTAEVVREDPYRTAKQHFQAGRYGLAIQGFQAVLARNPRSIRALNGLGASFDQLNRYEVAQAYYYRALDLDGDSVQTLNNLGYSLLLQERYGDAVQVLAAAKRIDEAHPRVHRNLALARERAVEGLERGKDRQPEEAQPRKVAALREPEPADRDSGPAIRDFEVVVANGNGRNGMAYLTSRYLKIRGVAVADVENAGHFGYKQTRVYYREGFETAAREVAAHLRLPIETEELPHSRMQGDVKVVLGEDFMIFDRALRTAALEAAGAAERDADGDALLTAAVEVSNGNGRTGMAAMVGRALGNDGRIVTRLTNAESFKQSTTTVYYRPGARRDARQLARSLPVEAVLKESDAMREDIGVRVVIGRDLLAHEDEIRDRVAAHA